MSVYVDALLPCVRNRNWRYTESCHLIADTKDELLEFADRLGLSWSWLQTNNMPHFDLTAGKRKLALRYGAVEIDQNTFVLKLRNWRKNHGKNKTASNNN